MKDIHDIYIETNRLIIRPVSKNSYESITKMFLDAKNNSFATGVYNNFDTINIQNKLDFDKSITAGFNLSAVLKSNRIFAGFFKGHITDKGKAWVHIFMIEPELRGNGYGTEFIEAVINYFYTNYNINCIKLSVIDANKKGIKFWKKVGFEQDAIVAKYDKYNKIMTNVNIFVKIF